MNKFKKNAKVTKITALIHVSMDQWIKRKVFKGKTEKDYAF